MLRFVFVFLTAVFAAGPALACNMSADARSSDLVKYVENGWDCFGELPETFRFDTEAERQFEREVNRERERAGLKRLKIRHETRDAARFHSLDMGVNKFFSHTSPGGLSHDERIAAFDRTLISDRSSENVAQFGPAVCTDQDDNVVSCLLLPGFELPTRNEVVEHLHEELMLSDGHRENILDPDVTHMSVGVARTDTGFYVTQLFVSVSGTVEEPLPLQFEAGDRIIADAQIDAEWDTYRFAVATEEETLDLTAGKIPADVSGDMQVYFRAERVEEGRNRKTQFWIYLSGPKISVQSSTGS
ncbi:MAG: CAP domain-containing protein [Pseudomonadota bacterium]